MEENGANTQRPDWWEENEQLRLSMDLPAYEPPRFRDGVYTHTVVSKLENEENCTIRIVGIDVKYGDDWEAIVNGERALTMGRHRDANGNTVFEVSADEFRDGITEELRSE